MKLSFNTALNSDTTEIISDGLGNSIEVPKKGCVSVAEELAISQIMMKDLTNIAYSQLKLKVVAAVLTERFKEKVTEDILIHQCPSMRLVEALYEFFENERRRWEKPSLVLECKGELAYETAREKAQELGNGAVVASREDFILQNHYFVYRDIKDVPESYSYKPNDVFGVGK